MHTTKRMLTAIALSVVALLARQASSEAGCSRCSFGYCEASDQSNEICRVTYSDEQCDTSETHTVEIGFFTSRNKTITTVHCKSTQRCEAVASCTPPITCQPSVSGCLGGNRYFGF
jgi:hypothetical protein